MIKRLGVDRWPGILAHELAHLARGDHWVVRLELLVEALWWWNPLFWLARRRLRELAELACDARVVRALPDRRFDYAEALVDVCEHIARSAIPSPSLGVGGAGAAHSLEGRLHMILKDPIPHRPSRRAATLAVLLAALAAPAWTLGQQPEAQTAKPDTPAPIKEQIPEAPAPKPEPKPAPAPEPEAPKRVVLSPTSTGLPSIDFMRDARALTWKNLSLVSFRLVVAEREQSRQVTLVGADQLLPVGVEPEARVERLKSVAVKVADVVVGRGSGFRYDVLEARARREGSPTDSPSPPVAWDRRFVAREGEDYTALGTAWDQSGPVPFRWLTAHGNQSFGDSLTAAIFGQATGGQVFRSSDLDGQFAPLDPRPENALDLNLNGVPAFLNATMARAEVLGIDMVDGRLAARIAWSSTNGTRLRGLCWVAFDLGDAIVQINATQDPANSNAPRRSWRRRSSDFVNVVNGDDHLWLPRKVTFEETLLDPASGEPRFRRERELTFEDYAINHPIVADTFRPKLEIRDLDDRTGHFTADAPALPAGLVDRLKKAVAESKFGPVGVEKTSDEPKPVATQPGSNPIGEKIMVKVEGAPVGRTIVAPPIDQTLAPAPKATSPARSITSQPADRAEPDRSIVARPSPRVEDPTTHKPRADQDAIDRQVERRFKLDPEVSSILAEIKAAEARLEDSRRRVPDRGDPANRANQKKLESLVSRYKQFWDDKSVAIREQIEAELSRPRDEAEVLKARRDGKAAEVRKAEAQRDLAKAVEARNARLKAKNVNMVSQEDEDKAKSELAIAEAEVASKQAELAEADALLNQARRRSGALPTASEITPPPADRTRSLADLRDDIELMEVQLQGKRAELRGVESKANLARRELASTKRLAVAKGVSQDEVAIFSDKAEGAQAEVEAKKAEVLESETRIKQARRRLAAAEARFNREIERAKAELAKVEALHKAAAISISEVNAARAKLEDLMIELEPKEAPTPATPAPKDQSRKDDAPDTNAGRIALLRADIVRAKDRLDWSDNMFKKDFVSRAVNIADQLTYDGLVQEMLRLDPKYVPRAAGVHARRTVAEGRRRPRVIGESRR